MKHFHMAVFSLCLEFLRRERFFLRLTEDTHIGSCVKKKKNHVIPLIWELPKEIRF